MNVSNRVILLGILLLAMLPAHALADLVINRYTCYITSPRGPYGVYQYQTLSGPFYAGTEVCLGPHHFEIPAPPFAVLAVSAFPVLGLFALYLPGFLSRPAATNFSVERMAAGAGGLAIRPLVARRHRSPSRSA
jgi:hypothetical protein